MKSIWRFSTDRWGRDRADRYLAQIQAVIADLSVSAGFGDRVRELGDDWHARRAQRHLVIYQIKGSTVRIVRVLHDRMDLTRHLP